MKQFSRLRFGAALVQTFALVPILHGQGTTPLTTPFRLPADVAAPVRYHVDLTVVPDQDTFTGSSDIDVELWLQARAGLQCGCRDYWRPLRESVEREPDLERPPAIVHRRSSAFRRWRECREPLHPENSLALRWQDACSLGHRATG
jgi:hypothetical protein